MKKTLFILLILSSLFLVKQGIAQEAPRYKMEMTIEANGKSAKVDLSSVNYSINRNVFDTTTADTKKEKGKAKEFSLYSAPNDFNISLTVNKVDKNILSIIAGKKGNASGIIIITDTYGKDEARKIEFRNGSVSNFSESLSGYSASYGNAGSLYINVKELIIDGIPIIL